MRLSTVVWLGWLAVFGALEIPAVLRRVPWLPMSDWVWRLERLWAPLPWLVIVALALLMVHLAARQY
jgi:hypothetical protein